MKKLIAVLVSALLSTGLIFPVAAQEADSGLVSAYNTMKTALMVLFLISGILILSCIMIGVRLYQRKKNADGHPQKTGLRLLSVVTYIVTAIVIICTVFCSYQYNTVKDALLNATVPPMTTTQPTEETTEAPTQESTVESTEETTAPTTVPPTEPDPTYTPGFVEDSDPEKWDVNWEIIQGGSIVDSFEREEKISFGQSSDYTALEGIITFRGDNYRTGSTYGTAAITDEALTEKWRVPIGSLDWHGCGWTGQPLVVRWDEETKAIMNLYEEKKAKEGLVEAIYATLDGYIYFIDIEDGSYTRDPLWIGMNFKGAGSLDPRGYPLLYVGSGDNYNGKTPRMYIISLIDGSILYERSTDSFTHRWWWGMDGAPLVDAETDTLIWPAESGILYTIDLNTVYDPEAGTISVSPEQTVKTRYTTNTGHTVGFESSVVAVGEYIYIADNGGMVYCVDLNTMELVWAQYVMDDVNATPVFEWSEDGKGYLYIATSMEYNDGTSYICKLDAATGEIIWEKSYTGIIYDKDVSGGALSTPLLGKTGTDLAGMIIFTVAKTPTEYTGIVVALDTQTGEVIWEQEMSYTWSSPAAVYTEDGNAYIVLCDSAGYMNLLDSSTGKVLSRVGLGGNVESSPTVFENMIIVGTKGEEIYGIEIS